MWRTLATFVFFARLSFTVLLNAFISRDEHVIFTSKYNITTLLVQADDKDKIHDETDFPSIFFTVDDPHFRGGSCIYVLVDLAAYEILEGGRDSTADYGSDRTVYFGSQNGVYRYEKESLSAKKLGPFKDDIIQLQKANNTDKIYYLTAGKELFVLEKQGTIRTKVISVDCATQFVLDTSDNIYYVQCTTHFIFILEPNSSTPIHVPEEFSDVKLIRPAFLMDYCIPIISDGTLLIVYSSGVYDVKDLYIPKEASAFSVDTGLHIAVAVNRKIYEYNVMEVLISGSGAPWPPEFNKVIVSTLSSKNVFSKGLVDPTDVVLP